MARGDRDALARLYDRYSGMLLAVAQRFLGGRKEAEDLLHDVFLEVWRGAGTYDGQRGSVRAWLLVRLRSRALDRVRSPGYRRATPLDDEKTARLPAASTEDPALAPDRAAVRRAMAALPSDQRAVLDLAYFDGMSSSEIADHLGIPIGTVKSRTAAALQKLRAGLERGVGGVS